MTRRRISNELSFVLNSYDWSESSLLLHVLTRTHGRVLVLAKGVKKPTSAFRAVLLPFQKIKVDYAGEGDVHTLKNAQWVAGHALPQGEALFAGYYINELVLKYTVPGDAHSAIFDAYAAAISLLVQKRDDCINSENILRSFEVFLLRELGFLPELNKVHCLSAPLAGEEYYQLHAEQGLQVVTGNEQRALKGSQWLQLDAALQKDRPFEVLVTQCAAFIGKLKHPLRTLLHHHSNASSFKSSENLLQIRKIILQSKQISDVRYKIK